MALIGNWFNGTVDSCQQGAALRRQKVQTFGGFALDHRVVNAPFCWRSPQREELFRGRKEMCACNAESLTVVIGPSGGSVETHCFNICYNHIFFWRGPNPFTYVTSYPIQT